MKPLIAFDQAHAETWTIDLPTSIALKPLCPEYHYYGHVADIAKEATGGVVTQIVLEWNQDTFSNIHVLVIAHPAKSSEEKNCGGQPIFSESEIGWIKVFVENGGGLFILGEWNTSNWGSNINDVLRTFGIVLNDDTLAHSRGGINAHLLSRHFLCTDIRVGHPLTSKIHRISYHRGCSISTMAGKNAQPLIFAPDGKPVFAVAEYGKGRVAVIGDTDLFSIPFIGHANNAQLLAQTIQWLAKIQPDALSHESIQQKSYPLRQIEHHIDITTRRGPHWIDCRIEFPELQDFSRTLIVHHPYEDVEKFLEDAALAFHELPREMRKRILDFRRMGNEHGVLLLKGLPIDPNLPNTPADSKRSNDKKTWISEFWLSTIAEALGDAVSYVQEKDGEIFQNLCPTKKNETTLSSESSKSTLDFHTEVAFHPFMPDFLLLYCLRPDHDKEAQTFFASTRHIIQQVPLKYRAILFEDVFKTGIDFSFGSQNGLQGNGPLLPVLHGNPYDPFMKFDLDLMKGLKENACAALEEMKQAVNIAKDHVKLDAGDLLIIDNKRAVHGRSYFTPRYDGFDRWLQRTFVVRDLTASEEDRRRGERIIQTEFIT